MSVNHLKSKIVHFRVPITDFKFTFQNKYKYVAYNLKRTIGFQSKF